MPSVTVSIHNFLRAQEHNAPDLIDRWNRGMETQVFVQRADGWPAKDAEGNQLRNTYENDTFRWWNIRVPKKANSEPEWNDYELNWPLDLYAEAIGCTGWKWDERVSRWIGFDFDSITGHAEGHGISKEQLEQVRDLASTLSYVEVRKSTGGAGIHLYVLLDDIPTANHTEHSALARCILSKMSSECGFDFTSQNGMKLVDVMGGNMWIWHRKMTKENEGLKLLKASQQVITIADLPSNWRDHIDVVTRRRSKVRVPGISDAEEGCFDQLVSSRCVAAFDDEHRLLMDWLDKNGYTSVWNHDHQLLITHTAALKAAHEELKLRGVFETVARGTEPGDQNCFCFPQPNGGWTVNRYGQGTQEAKTWTQSEQNWTFCHFNLTMDLKSASAAFDGLKASDGSYSFESFADVTGALKALGIAAEFPVGSESREVILSQKKMEIVAIMECEKKDDSEEMRRAGWRRTKNKRDWTKVWELPVESRKTSVNGPGNTETFNPTWLDGRVRHLVTSKPEDAGWAVCDVKGRWLEEPKGNASSVLATLGVPSSAIADYMGWLIINPWDLINVPFLDEFPGDRRWNRDAAKLAYAPSDRDMELSHPHWDMIFEHCGEDLDDVVAEDPWCRQNGIQIGGDYLRLWAAIMFQRPTHSLPYLFFYSRGQNTGKSSIHQALGLLFQDGKGYTEADSCLTSSNGFNRPLAGSILCYVEETDLSSNKSEAYNRLKNWVTADYLSIHPKGVDPYMLPNYTHWIQCGNGLEECPVFDGDSRIVMIHVMKFSGPEIPWKEEMRPALEREAPDFLRTLLDMQLPAPIGRLWLPVLETETKLEAMARAENVESPQATKGVSEDQLVLAIQQFLAEPAYSGIGGHRIPAGTRMFWQGTASQLVNLLRFDMQPNRLSQMLKSVRSRLADLDIEIIFPDEQLNRSANQRTLTIGPSFLVKRCSHEEFAEDEENCSRFDDELIAAGIPPV